MLSKGLKLLDDAAKKAEQAATQAAEKAQTELAKRNEPEDQSGMPVLQQSDTVAVIVPAGIGPGQQFQVAMGGAVVTVTCPPGVSAGDTISVQHPAPGSAAAPMAPVMPQQWQLPEQQEAGNRVDSMAGKVNKMFDQMLGQDDDKAGSAPMAAIPSTYTGPAGLATLAGVFPVVYLSQKVEAAEVMSNMLGPLAAEVGISSDLPTWEGANKYSVKDYHGNQLLRVDETEGECCDMLLRNACRREAPFRATVTSRHTGTAVLQIRSPWACDQSWACCLVPVCCCLRKLELRLSDGSEGA